MQACMRPLLGEVGGGHACSVTNGPLDEFDPVAVWVDDPRRPEVVGAVGGCGCLRLDAAGSELGKR